MSGDNPEDNKQTPEELEELKALLEQERLAKENLVNEIKEIRSKKQELEAKLEEKKESKPEGEETPEEIVNRILRERDSQSIKNELSQAELDFKKEHKEFLEENDPGGLKYQKYKDTLAKFNLSGLRTKDEVKQRMSEAYDYMNRPVKAQPINNYQGSPSNPGTPASTDTGPALNPGESKLLEQLGWSKEKFMEQKAKRPHYIQGLLRNIN